MLLPYCMKRGGNSILSSVYKDKTSEMVEVTSQSVCVFQLGVAAK